MPTISTTYEPFDPLNVCSLCGTLERKSRLRRLPGGLFACPRAGCAGERSAVELDRANARQRPFKIRPVPNARPQSWNLPDNYQADEGEILNFLERAVANQARFESVVGGMPAPVQGQMLPAFGWIARYLFGMISENKRPLVMIDKATSMLTSIATALRARQVGFGLSSSSTRANDALYGAFLESGATAYITQDAASCGLAMLYAYRVLGTLAYRDSARAAASYLRNVQAVGSNGTHFTSSDSAGTARLYTGGVASAVSTVAGFYSSGAFYPSDLLALEFWNALMTTDGDQSIGATAAVSGFDTTPARLLSTSISDMRSFWSDGVRDSAGETYTGLSATTPREFFNAYPATKPNFSSGTGLWEYQDGPAATGTMISAQNFAMALESLFSYEGASEQVLEVSDWLRSFDSNSSFESGSNESISEAARNTLGTYDASVAPSTLLQVRDADDSYAAIKRNGSSLYDWGALGLLSQLWGSRNAASFVQARLSPLGRNQRFYDGTRSDGDNFDWITNRGLSGLSYQTAFSSPTTGFGGQSSAAFGGGAGFSAPPMEGLVFWVRGDTGLESSGGLVSAWRDRGPLHQDLNTVTAGKEPLAGVTTLNGTPCCSFPLVDLANCNIRRTSNMLNRHGVAIASADPRTVMAVIVPRAGIVVGPIMFVGGPVISFRNAPYTFEALFDLENFFHPPGGFYVFANNWRFGGNQVQAPDTPPTTYRNVPLLAEWRSSGAPDLRVSVNGGTDLTLTPPGNPMAGSHTEDGFVVGNADNLSGIDQNNFFGDIAEIIVWDYILTGATLIEARNYVAARYTSLGMTIQVGMTNDSVRAAQFAQSFRVNPNFPAQV